MRINRHDTNGTKSLLDKGELGYDDYIAGGDAGRVYVGTGTANIPQAKKSEVVVVDGKVDTHVARVDNPHTVTKTQVGLGSVDNTADSAKVVASAGKWTTSRDITIGNAVKAVNGAGDVTWTLNEIGAIGPASPELTGVPTAPTAILGTNNTQIATTAFVNAEIANDAIPRVTSTDNAIARFDGTTGKLQNSGVIIDDAGNVGIGTGGYTGYGKLGLLGQLGVNCSSSDAISARGVQFFIDGNKHGNLSVDNYDNLLYIGNGLGYGTGSGGTVTQLTSKGTAVTLNKPTGQIITSNSSLAAGATAAFILYNSLLTGNDNVKVIVGGEGSAGAYQADCTYCVNGATNITFKNLDVVSRTDAVAINFTIIKGAVA